MSESNRYQQWCDEAKALLDIIHATISDYTEVLQRADTLLQEGQPPEMADEDWQGIQHYVEEARNGFLTKSQTKNKKKKQQFTPTEDQVKSVVLLRTVMETIATDTKTKKDALAKLRDQHEIEKSLDATGLAEIAKLEDPEAAFATVQSLTTRILNAANAIKDDPRLSKLVLDDLLGKVPEAEQKVKALDLDGALEVVETLEAGRDAAQAELKALLELQKTLTKEQVIELKLDGMRKLLKLQQKFTQIKDSWVQVIASVEEEITVAVGKSKKETEQQKSRKSQCIGILRDFPEILEQWPQLPPKDKVSDNGKISVGRLVARLEVVGRKPPELPAVDLEAAALLQQQKQQWTAFRNDVISKWQDYENSNFNPALRGPFPTNGVLTRYVRERCVMQQTVQISGRLYRCSPSITAGLSMKTPLSPPYMLNAEEEPIMSFIYHLPPL